MFCLGQGGYFTEGAVFCVLFRSIDIFYSPVLGLWPMVAEDLNSDLMTTQQALYPLNHLHSLQVACFFIYKLSWLLFHCCEETP